MILYSSGYPALVFFIGFFLVVFWQTRHVQGTAGLWLHAAPMVALSQIIVYGWLPAELQVVMVTAALANRYCQRTAGNVRPASRIHAPVIPAWPVRSRAAGPSDPPVSAL
jgi:hypothetical protein